MVETSLGDIGISFLSPVEKLRLTLRELGCHRRSLPVPVPETSVPPWGCVFTRTSCLQVGTVFPVVLLMTSLR